MSAINYLTLVSTIVVTSSGTPVPPGYINIASTNSAPSWSNSISTNGIQGSTIVVSSISGSTITTSTLSGSTLTVSTFNGSNIAVSSLNTSTLSGSTITGSTLTASVINVSTLNPIISNVSSLTASTLSVSTMTGSTLTISMLTGLIMSASSLSVSSMTSSDLVLSTLTVSSINGLPPGTGGGGSGGTTIFSTLGVSSLNANSTITTSSMNITTGMLGIGTTTPSYPMSVSNSGFINLEVNRTGAGNDYGAAIVHSLTSSTGGFRGDYAYAFGGATTIATSAQNQAYGYYGVDLANAGVFGVNTGGFRSSHFFMTTSAACFPKTNVGIGTTNPSHALQVAGAINCTSFLVNGVAVATGTGSVWGVNGSSAYYTSGNVGIGTASPSNSLTIYAGGSAQYIRSNSSVITGCYSEWRDFNATGRFIIGCDGVGLANFELGAGIIGTWSVNSVIFLTNAAERMRITSTGNVGIGTTSPTDRLHVSAPSGSVYARISTVETYSGIMLTESPQYYGHTIRYNSTTDALEFCVHDNTPTIVPKMYLSYAGSLGIGTASPSHPLQVAGAINCTSLLVNGVAVATGTGSVWGVSGSTAYYTSGNVGISTTAAITNLHVRVPTYSTPVFIVDAGGQGVDSTTVPRGIGKPLIGVGAYSWSNISSGDYYGIGFGYNANNAAATYYAAEIGFLTQTTSGGEYGDLVFSTRPTTNGGTIASERMRITSAGNIGIGTAVAAQTLSVYGTMGISSASGTSNSLFIKSASSTDYASMYFSNNVSSLAYIGIGGTGVGGNFQSNFFLQSPSAMAFNTNANGTTGTNTMYLTSTGNVGIGTVSPNTLLCVGPNGGVNQSTNIPGISMTSVSGQNMHYSVGQGTTGTNNVFLKWGYNATASSGYGSVSCYAGNNHLVLQEGGGSVGIGTITPGNKLHIYSTTANDGLVFQNAFNSSTGSIKLYTTTAAGNFILDGTADAGVVLPTDGKDLFLGRTTNLYTSMVVKGGTGYVGIGTAAPNASLQITNSSAVGSGYGALLVDSPNVGSAGGCVTIRNSAGGANAFCSLMFEIDGTTSCQTGTTPLGFAAGNAMIYCQNVGGGSNAGKLGFILWNGGGEVELFTILPSGNVGIGTATPATILHVARDVSTNDNFSLMTYYENTTPAYHDWAVGPYIDGGSATFAIRSGSNNLPTSLVNMFYINSNGTAIRFPQYTTTGTLSINGAGGTISSSSDRRIKQDIVYQTDTADALARVLQLRPATFRFLEQDATHLGFIAQDVEQCIPLAVDGKKYEWQWVPTENGAPTFDAEGNMIYQLDKDGNRIVRPRGLEDRAILAMQTLAIQQLAAENTQLKSQIASLLAWAQTQGFVQ